MIAANALRARDRSSWRAWRRGRVSSPRPPPQALETPRTSMCANGPWDEWPVYTPSPPISDGCTMPRRDRPRSDHLCVAIVDAAVAVQVIHPSVSIVVHEYVGGIAVHVTAVLVTSARIAAIRVVQRRPEPAHHRHVLHWNAFSLHLRDTSSSLSISCRSAQDTSATRRPDRV